MASGLENIETIESPFRRFVTTIGVFPTAFTDAMTYYECLAYLVKYLEDTVIPAVNENAEALAELQQYYIQLKSYVDNYFANLDVQEEINNKLDQMAEAGTLQEIITAYIQSNVAWTFDTVADMKLATNLVDGSYARTLGYHTINDGGGALYKITSTGTANEMDIIAVGNLKAHLIYCNEMNLTQFGVNHSSSDVTSSFNNVVSICANNGIKLIIPAHTYNLATITTKDVNGYHYKYFIEILPNMHLCGADKNLSILKIPNGTLDYTSIFFSDEKNVDNIKLENFTIDQYYTSGNNMYGDDRGNRKNVFTMYGESENIMLDNLNFDPCCGIDPIAFHNQNIKNVRVTNNNFNYHYVQNISWYDRSVVYMECSDYVVEGNTVNGNFETIGGIECHGYNGICKGNTVKKCKFAIYIAPRHDDTITHCNIMVIDNLILDSPCGVQIFGNTYPSSTVGTNGIMVNGNIIKSEGSVLSQNFWTQSGLAHAAVFSGIQINPDMATSYSDLHICNNSISIHNYAPYKASVSSLTITADTGISTFGKVDIDGAFITGNHIEGVPGPGIAIGETRSSASDFHTTQNVHITDNNVINCGYGPTDVNPYKAFIRIGFGIIKNVIIRNNILNKTDSSYATASAIYNQSNDNCSKTNLYCDHNILTSVVSDEFKVTSNPPFDMITDKGIASSRPTTANIGDQYYDTAFNKVIVWNGSAWINVNGSAL